MKVNKAWIITRMMRGSDMPEPPAQAASSHVDPVKRGGVLDWLNGLIVSWSKRKSEVKK